MASRSDFGALSTRGSGASRVVATPGISPAAMTRYTWEKGM